MVARTTELEEDVIYNMLYRFLRLSDHWHSTIPLYILSLMDVTLLNKSKSGKISSYLLNLTGKDLKRERIPRFLLD